MAASDLHQAIHLWSTMKVTNPHGVEDSERDGFRYAWNQLMGNPASFRANPTDPDFARGEQQAVELYEAALRSSRPTRRRLYRAMGLTESQYTQLMERVEEGTLDLPLGSWSTQREQTAQFGTDQPRRVVFELASKHPALPIGQSSLTRWEKERITGGQFKVEKVNAGGADTVIGLRGVVPFGNMISRSQFFLMDRQD
jgi:hypothetical protein